VLGCLSDGFPDVNCRRSSISLAAVMTEHDVEMTSMEFGDFPPHPFRLI
jgi:hypothetical protein